MIIAIDASRANQPQRTGPASYAFHLLQAMRSCTPAGVEVVLLTNQPLNHDWGQLPFNWRVKVLKWPFGIGWTSIRLPWHLWRKRYQLFWQPTSVNLSPRSTKLIVTVHDLAFLEAPHVYSSYDLKRQWRLLNMGRKRVDHLLTVSEYTKQQLINFLGFKPDCITVTSIAGDKDVVKVNDQNKISEVKNKYKITKPYFISAGRIEKKKGIVEIVEAFNQLDNHNYELVLTGRYGFGADEVRDLIKKYHLEERVKILGWVSNQDLSALLSSAVAYISACRYEGFGIAVMDALQCGCPVVTYNAGAIPETVGEAALLVDPSGPQSLVEGLNKIISQPELARKLSQDGLSRAQQFSWQKTAELTWQGIVGAVSRK